MKSRSAAIRVTLLLALCISPPLAAQAPDAFVLPPGMLRLHVDATHASFASAFDAEGESVPLAGALSGPLDPTRFAPLQPLTSDLQQFFAATSGSPVEPGGISLGTADLQAAASRTETRLGLAFGLLPRIEIGGSIAIHRGDRTIQRFGLAGGTVGLNPDVAGNIAILERIGWESLGSSVLLPVADSPEGVELQNRVTALAGEAMTLPTDTADFAVLNALIDQQLGVDPIASGVDRFRLGDTEIYARVLLLSTMGRAPFPPAGAGLHLRVSATAGARIATGEANDTLALIAPPTESRIGGFFGAGAADLFLGSRFWGTGSVRFSSFGSTEVLRRSAPADAPLSVAEPPVVVSMSPGTRLELHLVPRYRLTEAISLAARYSAAAVGDTEFEGAAVPGVAGGTVQRVGLGIRYSSMSAYWERLAAFPADVSLDYLRTLTGPQGAPGGGLVTVSVSFLPQLYGRR